MKGSCENCETKFDSKLIHNGFNESAFAYCDKCGATGFIDGWRSDIPESAQFKAHGPVTLETEALLAPCECGGTFRRNASPRCPKCNSELSPKVSASWIESQSPGTEKGWKWQNTWQGTYAIIINDKSIELSWKQ